MSLEPVRRDVHELIPSSYSAGFRERRELAREARRRIFNEQLGALITSMRMCNGYKLHQQMIELHIQMSEEFAKAMASSDNPLLRDLLEGQFEVWKRTSNDIIAGRIY
ncbi:hypothetical protein AB0H73_21840 [Streptomyces olivoreticuli]